MQQLEMSDHLQPSPEIENTRQQETADNMIKIAGEEAIPEYIDNKEVSPQSNNNDTQQTGQHEDQLQDTYVKGFLKDLMKVGPFSKQIMNYSYPPLLYQRGDDSDEEEEEDENEDDSQNSQQF